MTVASIAVGGVEAKAADYQATSLTKVTENVWKPYYKDGDVSIFNNGDTIYFPYDSSGGNYALDVSVEGGTPTSCEDGLYTFTSRDGGKWIVSDYNVYSSEKRVVNLSIVSATAEPQVYLAKSEGNAEDDFVKLTLGDAGSDGMAIAALPANSGVNDFYDGLTIKVRKTVDKLEKGSLKVEIKGKDGKDYTDYFDYYRDAEMSQLWGYDINDLNDALGGALSSDVKVYIKPAYSLLRIKASAGEGGRITPNDGYYVAYSSPGIQYETYTITPNEGYEIDKVERHDQGDAAFRKLDPEEYPEGKYGVYSAENSASNALNLTEIKAYFKTITFNITVEQGANGTITPGTASVPFGKNQAFTIKPDTGYQIKDVKVDGISALSDVSMRSGTGTYTFTNVREAHTITAEFEKAASIIFDDTDGDDDDDAVVGMVVTVKDGKRIKARATVPMAEITAAMKAGRAVTPRVEVPVAASTQDALVVEISMPKIKGSLKVELPVDVATPGTVAVLVNAYGGEKIIATSVATEDSVVLTLEDSVTLKIIDNTKRFADVPADNVFYNEICSMSAREIMVGKSDELFDLYSSVTLNQIANVAGRISGAVDVSDFQAGIAWGQENGLKTGNVAATRGDVLRALYIAAGSPAVEDTGILARFSDASSIPADMMVIAAWAAQNGILKGGTDGSASLGANVTRGQACALAGRTLDTLV